MRAILLRSWVALLLAVLTTSCSEPVEDQNLQDVITQQKICDTQIQAGNYEQARNAAEVVVNTPRLASVDNVAVDRARFCYTTANTLYQLNELTTSLSKLLTTAVSLLGGNVKFATPEDYVKLVDDYHNGRLDPQAASIISTVIGGFINPIKTMLEENQAQLEVIIKKGRYNHYAEHVPVKIAGVQIIDLGGKTDMGEIYVLYGLTRALLGLFYLGDSQDYNFDLGSLLAYIKVDGNALTRFSEAPEDEKMQALVGAGLNMVAVLMGTSPKFLSLDNEIGLEMMTRSGKGFSDAFDAILKAVKFMKDKRKGDQSAYVIEYRREAVNGREEDIFVLNWEFNQAANPLPIVDLAKFNGMAIPLGEEIQATMERLRDDFGGVDGVDTSLQDDIFPMVALVTVVLLNTGAFDAIIGMVTGSLDPAQQAQVDQVLTLVKENRDLVTGALVALVPVPILFDLGNAFKDPRGLREMFPAWTQPESGAAADFTNATIVYSYECKDGSDPLLEGTFLCDDAQDKPHFNKADGSNFYAWNYALNVTFDTGLNWANVNDNFGESWNTYMDSGSKMGLDGMTSTFPYIGFKDPTFGGILYLDASALENAYIKPKENGYEPADLKTLNATIAKIFDAISGFL